MSPKMRVAKLPGMTIVLSILPPINHIALEICRKRSSRKRLTLIYPGG
jgi:hypothetical protein